MQVKINIKPENEEMFIKALNDSNIPYWIEENEEVATQDVSSDVEDWQKSEIDALAAEVAYPIKTKEDYYVQDVDVPYYEYNCDQMLLRYAFLAGCKHVRKQLSKEHPLK